MFQGVFIYIEQTLKFRDSHLPMAVLLGRYVGIISSKIQVLFDSKKRYVASF